MKVIPATCGECMYAVPDGQAKLRDITAEQYLCHGNPPTAQMVPVQGPGGAGQWVGMAARAPVKGNDRACWFFRRRDTLQSQMPDS